MTSLKDEVFQHEKALGRGHISLSAKSADKGGAPRFKT